jgi:hypothetical protein
LTVPKKAKRKPVVSALECTAYHEAGHAIAEFSFGRRIRRITIEPNDNALGNCISEKPPRGFQPDVSIPPYHAEWIYRQIVSLFAGSVAEAKHRGRKNHIGASSDYHAAVHLASYLPNSTRAMEKMLAWLHQRAVDLFEQEYWWRMVEALATELLVHKTLSGKRAHEIFCQATQRELQRHRVAN